MKTTRTPEKDAEFFTLIATGIPIGEACVRVGYTRSSAYAFRKSDPAFAAAWSDAVELAIERLEKEADRRAHDGVEKPMFHKGVPVMMKGPDGELVPVILREYSDTLLIFRLKALRPEVYRERADISGTLNVAGLADRLNAARKREKTKR